MTFCSLIHIVDMLNLIANMQILVILCSSNYYSNFFIMLQMLYLCSFGLELNWILWIQIKLKKKTLIELFFNVVGFVLSRFLVWQEVCWNWCSYDNFNCESFFKYGFVWFLENGVESIPFLVKILFVVGLGCKVNAK